MDQDLHLKRPLYDSDSSLILRAGGMMPEAVTPSNFSELFARSRECQVTRGLLESSQDLFVCSENLEGARFPKLWIIDGDDTLWEDNIYYEQLAGDLASYLFDKLAIERSQFRQLLDRVEHETIPIHGFGPLGFKLSVEEAFRRATHGLPKIDEPREIFERVLPLLTGVPYTVENEVIETLRLLRSRGDGLVLFTQGPIEVQQGKIARSNIAPLFHGLAVGTNKRDETYRAMLKRLPYGGQNIIVVGNSINSEVLPALRLGMKAVHLENPNSWHAVNSASIANDTYTKVRSFRELLDI